MKRLAMALSLCAAPALAQDTVTSGTGAVLRALDKLTGEVRDLQLASGDVQQFGRVTVDLQDCRYPDGNPSGEAYAFVTVRDSTRDLVIFSGWLVASSPALNPVDHPRYDVWVMRCTTS